MMGMITRAVRRQGRASPLKRMGAVLGVLACQCAKVVTSVHPPDAEVRVAEASVPSERDNGSTVFLALTCPFGSRVIRTSVRSDGAVWYRELIDQGMWSGLRSTSHSPEDSASLLRRVESTGIHHISPDSYQPGPIHCQFSVKRPGSLAEYDIYPCMGSPYVPPSVQDAVDIFQSYVR